MRLLLVLILTLSSLTGYSQQAPEIVLEKGEVIGLILDKASNIPIEYVNIAIFTREKNELITGSITDNRGQFSIQSLKPGSYRMVIKFIGFNDYTLENIQIDRQNPRVDIGKIFLSPSIASLQGIEVVADKKAVSYKIDKKVVNPSQFMSASSGTAIDILANTPSITVDVEGNVSLRGSSNFTVLIDGRPTPFSASDALEQVPASQIESIELITNPSAKYDPDGTSGIINIITKKNKEPGVNGIINATASTIGTYSGDVLLNFRKKKLNYYIGANRSDRKRSGSSTSRTESYKGDTTFFTFKDGMGDRGFTSNSLKTGLSYSVDDQLIVGVNISGGTKQRESNNTADYSEGSTFSPSIQSKSLGLNKSEGSYVSGDLNFEKKFASEGHQLTGLFYFERSQGEESSVNDQTGQNDDLIQGHKSWENDEGTEYRLQLDYVLPLSQLFKLELGYQLRNDAEDSWTDQYFYTEDNNIAPDVLSPNYYESTFQRQIHAAYSTFSGEISNFGYQLGLRSEYTYRQIDYMRNNTPINSSIDRFDFFPTLHFAYKIGEEDQFMTSYSRRIERPRGHYLEPFETWTDAYSVRSGNPALQPEYINSYEAGYQKGLKKGFVSLEAFYRKTNNKIDRVQSRWTDPSTGIISNIITHRYVDNTGTDQALGIEGMLNLNLYKWWSLNINGSTFNYRVEGDDDKGYRDAESQNWNTRISNTFNLSTTSKIQFDYMYHSPSISAQGERGSFAFSNLSYKQEFLKRKLSATISVKDVFNTAKFEFTSLGDGFLSSRQWDMTSPIIQLQLSYKINNFMAKRERGESGEGGGMDMDGY